MDTILSNTIFASLMMTVIVVIILLGCYYNTSVSAGGIKKQVRTVFYLFLGVLVAMYIHHYALGRAFKKEHDKGEARNTFKQIINPAINIGATHAVVPNISDANFEIAQRGGLTPAPNSWQIAANPGVAPQSRTVVGNATTITGGFSPAITGGGERRTVVGSTSLANSYSSPCTGASTCALHRVAPPVAPATVAPPVAPAMDDLELDKIDFGKSLV